LARGAARGLIVGDAAAAHSDRARALGGCECDFRPERRPDSGSEAVVIPTLLLPGLLLGRWWLVPLAAVVWPGLLVATGVGSGAGFLLAAGALAAANMAVGVGVHRVIVQFAGAAWRRGRPHTEGS
jgi:hypothetical protein